MKTFTKQPNDVLDFDVDMTEWFSGIPGDEIERVELAVHSDAEATPMLLAGPLPHPASILMGASPLGFKVWLGGGTAYIDYIVTCLVFTEQDRQKEVEFKIRVRDL